MDLQFRIGTLGIVAATLAFTGTVAGCQRQLPIVVDDTQTPGATVNGDGAQPPGTGKPRFTFKPAPPGRAVGLRAIVEMQGKQLTSREFELILRDGAQSPPVVAKSSALTSSQPTPSADAHVGLQSSALCGMEENAKVTEMETVSGSLCWLGVTQAAGTGVKGQAHSITYYFAREGVYRVVDDSPYIYYPPSFGSISQSHSVGCLRSPNGETVAVEYLLSLKSVSASWSYSAIPVIQLLPITWSVGISVFRNRQGFQPAVQYDTGFDASFSPLTLSLGLPFLGPAAAFLLPALAIQPVPEAGAPPSLPTLGPTLTKRTACGVKRTAVFENMGDLDAMQESDDPAQRAIADSVEPLLNHLRQSGGSAAGPNVIAGNDSDAFANIGTSSFGTSCANCPASTLDDLSSQFIDVIQSSGEGQELAQKSAPVIAQLPNVLPSMDELSTLMRRARSGVELSENVYSRKVHNGKDVYIASDLVEVQSKVGDTVQLTFTTAELAKLLGRATAEVLGATLRVDGAPYVAAGSTVLGADELTVSFTQKTADPILFKITVDITTAKGVFPTEAQAWYIELAPRLVKSQAGPATQVRISGPVAITAGGSVSLSAGVVDDAGNPVDQPVMVRFEDADGNMLGSSMTQYGFASVQYVPTATSPVIDTVRHVQLVQADKTTLDGTAIDGGGFSANCGIYADGTLLDPMLVRREVKSSGSILVAMALPVGAEMVVVNPGGQQSNPVRVAGP